MANETKFQLPNGQWLMLRAGDGRLQIGHSTPEGDESWICSFSNNGVNVFTSSGDAVEVMTDGLSIDDEIVLPNLNDEVIKARLMNLVENMTIGMKV